jgi:hypothetical protein
MLSLQTARDADLAALNHLSTFCELRRPFWENQTRRVS